ncbi:MAG: MBL fold metallo-hydrolase [Cyanobacteria bacterium RUI128]|nr:MBL fold metallo-hydrolase [Cyanobacteria bacterium RUI128]
MILRKFVVGEMGNNNYLLVDNGEAALVDCTGIIPELDSVLKELKAELKYVFLTHAHFDHIGGIVKLQEKHNCKVYLHEDDKNTLDTTNDFMQAVGMLPMDIPEVDVWLKDGDKVKVGDEEIDVLHFPGHTPGGVGYKTGNMLFAGDTIFMSSVGRTDLPGGDADTLVDTIRNKIFTLDDNTIIYPGHGTDTSVGFEKKYNSFV